VCTYILINDLILILPGEYQTYPVYGEHLSAREEAATIERWKKHIRLLPPLLVGTTQGSKIKYVLSSKEMG